MTESDRPCQTVWNTGKGKRSYGHFLRLYPLRRLISEMNCEKCQTKTIFLVRDNSFTL